MNNKVIGERLVSLRGSRTQDEVAKAIGVSQSSYAMYESGVRTPRDNVKIAIAKYYKKSIQSIFYA